MTAVVIGVVVPTDDPRAVRVAQVPMSFPVRVLVDVPAVAMRDRGLAHPCHGSDAFSALGVEADRPG